MENQISFNHEELNTLSQKINQFGGDLSEKEKAVLDLIILRAGGNTNPVLKPENISFSDDKEALINLANAIEGKQISKTDVEWYFSWTHYF